MPSRRSGNMPAFAWPFFLLIAVIALLLLSAPEQQEKIEAPLPPQLYSSAYQLIGTGNRLGTYYPAGNVLADWFNSHLDENGGVFKAVETNGSIDNVRLLLQGRLMMGLVESRIAKETYEANASSSLRLIWPLWHDVVHLVKTPERFEPSTSFPGRLRGFLGQKNSSTFRTSREILAALDYSVAENGVEFSPDSVLNALATGKIGFATIQAGIPNRTVSDALIFHDCTLVNLSQQQIQKILSKVATARQYSLPAGFYGDSQPSIQTIGLPNVLVTTDKTPAETVELITDILARASTHLKMKHQVIAAIPNSPEKALAILEETGVPLHDGVRNWLAKHLPQHNTAQEAVADD